MTTSLPNRCPQCGETERHAVMCPVSVAHREEFNAALRERLARDPGAPSAIAFPDTPAPAPFEPAPRELKDAAREILNGRKVAKEPAALNRADARNLYEMLLELRNDLKNNLNRIEHAVERFARFKY